MSAPAQLPVFSERLDEVMAAMLEGKAPNVGRFCGYCYTPLGKKRDDCPHCGRTTDAFAPVAKIPLDFFALYKAKRRRESLIVNSFAYLGLALALVLFIGLVALAVYRFNQSLWVLAFATGVLIVGGRVFAGLLGGWIGDQIGYDYAQRKLAVEWEAYERDREVRLGRAPAPLSDAAAPPAATTSPSRAE
ncbi:MAG TPA: zinc ribbon domain-containing protein [Dehalococcoidia bacterium]|nr:zinc ribbon domain-containing protein [Dehalococcoidia bacterium]